MADRAKVAEMAVYPVLACEATAHRHSIATRSPRVTSGCMRPAPGPEATEPPLRGLCGSCGGCYWPRRAPTRCQAPQPRRAW